MLFEMIRLLLDFIVQIGFKLCSQYASRGTEITILEGCLALFILELVDHSDGISDFVFLFYAMAPFSRLLELVD